ncbi:hypothetical protein [Brevundimonas sp. SL161]|uniref:hypothetical protein n=1 Tax=Brevundimonas sp. SL161 TaxID=2804613 RepID=UPI003CF25572
MATNENVQISGVIYDDGELVGYGAISSVNIQVQPNSRVEIPGYRLIVKRCANVGWAAQ